MALVDYGNQSPFSLSGGPSGGVNWASLQAPAAAPSSPAPSMPQTSGGFRSMGGSTATGYVGAPYVPPSVPNEMYGRLRDVLQNPGNVANDPAYKFIVDQGNQALSRSAGARRMRFAGKTMNEFQDFGQRAASQYWQQLAQTLGQGANTELERWKADMARAQIEGQQRSQFMQTPEYRLGQAETYGDRPRTEYAVAGGAAGIRPGTTNEGQWRRARDMYSQFFPR